MSDAAYYENSWAELLKASRNWQIQYDVQQLLTDVCHTAHDLLGFELASAYLLEQRGVTERAHWPEASDPAATPAPDDVRLEVAQNVIQSGRAVFMQKVIGGKHATMLCAPLTASREILGALQLLTTQQARKIGDKDHQFFELLASQAAASLEHTLLYQSAITDPLTGLFCHRHFRQEVDQAVRRAIRNEEPITLLLMDLDRFKELNDTCGHEAGNQCLQQVASILRSTFRSTDILARFGGDEFEVLLLDTGAEDSVKLAEKVREKVSEIALPQNKQVTATVGVASFPLNAFSAQPLFLCADAALYAAKEAGRNRVLSSVTKPGEGGAAGSILAERAVRLLGSVSPTTAQDLPPAALKPGAVEMIDGHIVKRRLGVGSMGEVLLVTQPGLDREVALKRPLTAHQTFEQSQSFETEAKITAGLNHPGIVPIFNIGRDQDNRRYYTMKPLDGRTLQQIVDARRKGDMDTLHVFTPGRMLDILQRVSETVAYAHTRDVLHLDLTPGNILVGKFGEVTVIDWSTGSHESYSKSSDSQGVKLIGSASFIAPELIRGKQHCSAASDVFALGTLLYLLLTDTLPFHRATTRECVDALLNGRLTPPDVLKPELGIDPMLSSLCVSALATDPAQRPGAAAFAERLGLFLRGESDWTTTRFGLGGPGEHPLRAEEWLVERGQWRIEGDNWITTSPGEGTLLWKDLVPGSFRFSCEAWSDLPDTELSIIGHRPPPGTPGVHAYAGYYFQVGAENNTVYKLARHDNDVMVKTGLPLEPGRRYRIEMEYQDAEGLVHCALNGKRMFTYRELFPFPGAHVGFYSFGAGTHYRPLELMQQHWNVQIPALRAADRHFQYGHHAAALDCYSEIAKHIPDRLQGTEALLKAGICQVHLGRHEEAAKTLDRVTGTIFEPFAISERAIFEMGRASHAGLNRARALFRDLFQRFPDSQAGQRIFDAARYFGWAWANDPSGTRANDVNVMVELHQLAIDHFKPPATSQVVVAARLASYQVWLGRYDEALDGFLKFRSTLTDRQLENHDVTCITVMLALAAGRLEFFPKVIQHNSHRGYCDYPSGIFLHHAVHWNTIPEWKSKHGKVMDEEAQPLLLLLLAERNVESALELLNGCADCSDLICFRRGWVIAESLDDRLFDRYVAIHEKNPDNAPFVRIARALRALELRDFAAAADALSDLRGPMHPSFCVMILLLQTMLASLGELKNPSLKELQPTLSVYLCGTALDLAQMFTDEREPVPGKLWPHPRWHPEWRLLLGLWLEAKGRGREAHDIVAPSRDPRYGLTHSQPGIEALLKRTGP